MERETNEHEQFQDQNQEQNNGRVLCEGEFDLKVPKTLLAKVSVLAALRYALFFSLGIVVDMIAREITMRVIGVSRAEMDLLNWGGDVMSMMLVAILLGFIVYHLAAGMKSKLLGVLALLAVVVAAWLSILNATVVANVYNVLLVSGCAIGAFFVRWASVYLRTQEQKLIASGLMKECTTHFEKEVLPELKKLNEELKAQAEDEIAQKK